MSFTTASFLRNSKIGLMISTICITRFFEFLVLRQGRASAWPVGKMAVKVASTTNKALTDKLRNAARWRRQTGWLVAAVRMVSRWSLDLHVAPTRDGRSSGFKAVCAHITHSTE